MGDDLEDDDDDYLGLYEDGHWEWCNTDECLVFKSYVTQQESFIQAPLGIIGSGEFKDDMDVIEQQKFRKRFQRKTDDDDVVTLQDVKDLVFFTAPKYLITTIIVKIMHFLSTERFLRALISYCQYYLQITEVMSQRTAEQHHKIRSEQTDEIENEFRENLEDLRLLLAKEYCAIILGAEEFSKYHHMGVSRKMRSLSKKEAIQFESILRLSTQIVWLALGRRSYTQIELEINRLFKSDIYNITEHRLQSKYRDSLSANERLILFGSCLKQGCLVTVVSPLLNETNCAKSYHYQLMALGQIKYERLQPRLRYLEHRLILPESQLSHVGISIGIIGLPRNQFDTMLRPLPLGVKSSSCSVKSTQSRLAAGASSKGISRKSIGGPPPKLYEDMMLPESEGYDELPKHFPTQDQAQNPCFVDQRKKWLMHTLRLKRSAKNRRT